MLLHPKPKPLKVYLSVAEWLKDKHGVDLDARIAMDKEAAERKAYNNKVTHGR